MHVEGGSFSKLKPWHRKNRAACRITGSPGYSGTGGYNRGATLSFYLPQIIRGCIYMCLETKVWELGYEYTSLHVQHTNLYSTTIHVTFSLYLGIVLRAGTELRYKPGYTHTCTCASTSTICACGTCFYLQDHYLILTYTPHHTIYSQGLPAVTLTLMTVTISMTYLLIGKTSSTSSSLRG